MVDLVECPRDAMQGWKAFIPTAKKVQYLNSLLKVGFHTLDCGSFVSPKAIPQMADTREVIPKLEVQNTNAKLLVIVANVRGAGEAVLFDQITYLGFPFSISPTFQQRNTNSSIEESLKTVDEIQNLCLKNNKELVVYLSMGFGNPYGDEYNEEILLKWADTMMSMGIKIISLADTVGVATPQQITLALEALIPKHPETTIGVHLHSTLQNWQEKLEAAVNAGCKRIDGALKGIGGCPMANDDLVGNMDSELMIPFLKKKDLLPPLNEEALKNSITLAEEIFTTH
ncbi:MAG TPA: hydroxymethylglutaryl-CoA lyase [Segetibacter sp.]|jgi:hydroxymethylglutaryl-CoA lyase